MKTKNEKVKPVLTMDEEHSLSFKEFYKYCFEPTSNLYEKHKETPFGILAIFFTIGEEEQKFIMKAEFTDSEKICEFISSGDKVDIMYKAYNFIEPSKEEKIKMAKSVFKFKEKGDAENLKE